MFIRPIFNYGSCMLFFGLHIQKRTVPNFAKLGDQVIFKNMTKIQLIVLNNKYCKKRNVFSKRSLKVYKIFNVANLV
ncbi:hypothetical protein NPIL_421171 [Nephila pilipes]|uniref:Uncharacterized protein n=1 Tax=Nephila pilipes TaxID=299642 RepID=A0A8X6IGE2_NEPPI|nr:hypothetical protein NPIL_421171 [Nephila pilipes]